MESIVKFMKDIIDKWGVEYLRKEPYRVYRKLISAGADKSYAGLVLITLLDGAGTKAMEMNAEELSGKIQKGCFLRKKAADEMAAMYKSLFDAENMMNWTKKKNCGFREFCNKTWEFKWSGNGEWRSGGGHIDCWCSIEAEIEVSDETAAEKAVGKILKENPFTPVEKINDYFCKQMSEALAADLEDYVTCEEYYPPVMEDYSGNGEYALEECCKELGLKIISFECDGSMSDFEPDHMRW